MARYLSGFRTSGWRYWPLDLTLQELARIGYGAVEFCLEHPDAAPRVMTEDRCARVVAMLEQHDLALASVSFHGKREHPALKTDYTRRLVDVAARIRDAGAPADVLVVGSCLPGRDPDDQEQRFQHIAGLMRETCERAADAGFVVALEPEPDTVIEGTAEMDRLLDAVDHPALRVNLDLGHAEVTEGDVEGSIRHFASVLSHVHVEDIANRVHHHLVPGQGTIDLAGAFRTLWEVGYRRPLTIDMFNINDDAPGWAQRCYDGLSAAQAQAFPEA